MATTATATKKEKVKKKRGKKALKVLGVIVCVIAVAVGICAAVSAIGSNGNLKFAKSFAPVAYEEQLQGGHFVRCNACYLVNLKYVRGIVGDTVRVHEDSLPISKSKRKEFLAALAQYKGGSR